VPSYTTYPLPLTVSPALVLSRCVQTAEAGLGGLEPGTPVKSGFIIHARRGGLAGGFFNQTSAICGSATPGIPGVAEEMALTIQNAAEEAPFPLSPREEVIQLWMEIPGVGWAAACSTVAELGVNMDQFPSAAHVASWAGLCPGNNESAGKRLSGKTRKGNVWLRRTMCEVAWAASHTKDSYFAAQFRRIARAEVTNERRWLWRTAFSSRLISHAEAQTALHGVGRGLLRCHQPRQSPKRLVQRLTKLGFEVKLKPKDAVEKVTSATN